jgi:CBS domain-containing protein
MTVAHILGGKGRHVVTLPPSTSVLEAARFLAENKIGAIVIAGATGTIEGILSERDIVRQVAKIGADALSAPVSAIMTKQVKTCLETDSEADLMKLMTANRIRHVPVVDGARLVGIVSIGDVVKYRMEAIEREAEELQAYIATAG